MIIFLSKNLEIKIVAKATNKEKLTITVFKALRAPRKKEISTPPSINKKTPYGAKG